MILEQLAEHAHSRVAAAKRREPLEALRRRAEALPPSAKIRFCQALAAPGLSFICEIKRASPSRGLIVCEFPYLQIAREYQAAGAAAISVLTEPDFFLGRDSYLREVAQTVALPVLRKDFTVDAYQLYEARLLGASAVLLICALLDKSALEEYLILAGQLELDALVEVRDAAEIQRALAAGAGMIGVNNRNLRDFTVDMQTSLQLRALIPPEVLFVAESGIHSPADIAHLRQHGTDAVLIGEALMRAEDKAAFLRELRGGDG
ncbi:MAG: indole-3-glycerol phosphate synthase TrpC [Oscillospiraceae bacterium]|jgi:indole-3-glycerol phosphate synthase|nr:indole-3-glycerol phosphate synthase TrpC [Oscillospiraceae bacterium]